MVKTSLLFICLVVGMVLVARGQDLKIPRDEFEIQTSDSVSVEIGSLKKMSVQVLRSKPYAKYRVKMGVASPLPQDVELKFESQHYLANQHEFVINVGSHAKPGVYNVILSGSTRFSSKACILKLRIHDATTSGSASGH